jgi:hypothetical protein
MAEVIADMVNHFSTGGQLHSGFELYSGVEPHSGFAVSPSRPKITWTMVKASARFSSFGMAH